MMGKKTQTFICLQSTTTFGFGKELYANTKGYFYI